MLRRLLVVLSLVLVGSALGAVAAEAEKQHRCNSCVVITDGVGNSSFGYGGTCSIPMANCVDCDIFFTCVNGGTGTNCPEAACGTVAANTIKEVQDMVRRGDQLAVVSVANRNPKNVRITEDGYVLVLNCKGGVASAIKLGTSGADRSAKIVVS